MDPQSTGAAMSCPTSRGFGSWAIVRKIAHGYDNPAAPSLLCARIIAPYVMAGWLPVGSVASHGVSQAALRRLTSYHCLRCEYRSGANSRSPYVSETGQMVGSVANWVMSSHCMGWRADGVFVCGVLGATIEP